MKQSTKKSLREQYPSFVGSLEIVLLARLCQVFDQKLRVLTLARERVSASRYVRLCVFRPPYFFLPSYAHILQSRESSTEAQREDHEDEIISVVRASLVDDEANVRTAAARAFDTLQEQIGAKAIDMTIPTLLEALRQPGKGSGTALMALREVMSVRAATVFPVLIPTLTALPMSVFNARALGALVTVAGNALSKRLTVILGALVKVLEDQKTAEELREAADEALRALLESIGDLEGLNTLMMLLLGWYVTIWFFCEARLRCIAGQNTILQGDVYRHSNFSHCSVRYQSSMHRFIE